MMRAIAFISAALFLSACDQSSTSRQEQLFRNCINSINTSDTPGYAEVVKACSDAAIRIAPQAQPLKDTKQ